MLRRGVAAAEDPLDGQQGEPVLLDRGLQLLEREALVRELLEQLLARGAVVALESVEQPGLLKSMAASSRKSPGR